MAWGNKEFIEACVSAEENGKLERWQADNLWNDARQAGSRGDRAHNALKKAGYTSPRD